MLEEKDNDPQDEAGQQRKYEFSQRCVLFRETEIHVVMALCCTIIESWFVIAWSWGPLPRLQANGGPCPAGETVQGPFFRRSLAVVQATKTTSGWTNLTAGCRSAAFRPGPFSKPRYPPS